MSEASSFNFFLRHSAKDEAVMRPRAERLQADDLRRSRVLVLRMSAQGFGSDWAQFKSGTFRFRGPINKERRFLPARLDDAPSSFTDLQEHRAGASAPKTSSALP